MKKLHIFIILAFVLLVKAANAGVLPPQKVKPGQWLQNWLLCGPIHLEKEKMPAGQWKHISGFEKDYLAETGGEQNAKIKDGSVISLRQGALTWKRYNSPDSVINLDIVLSKEEPVAAYAYTEIESPESKIWFLALGTNDGGSLWLNGEQIWDHPSERGLSPDDDVIPVRLKKGLNTILLKVEERGGSWGFCMRFLPFSTSQFKGSGELFRVVPGRNGKVELRSQYMESVLKQLVRKIEIEIRSENNELISKERRKGNYLTELKVNPQYYSSYNLLLDVTLENNEVISRQIPFFAGKRQEYLLFSNNSSDYRIAIDPEASESEQLAAEELQYWISEVSGVRIPVQKISSPYDGPQIVIGFNEWVKNKTGKEAPEKSDESFTYLNAGPDIIIYGGKERGTMYGVMTFLEKEMGCRWYTPSVSVAPAKSEYKFVRLNHSESPGIRVRNDFYFEAFDPVWAARNRMNGAMSYREQAGGVEGYWAVHTFYRFMPPEEFYDEHPEYYSLVDGKRIHDHAQLCLTNPDVLKIVTERVKKTIRENPEYLIYSVSQNDWRNPCQCEKCQAIAKKEGSESGPLLWFVNQVAKEVEKEFPDKYIGTLAYQYTRKPPENIKPRENVVIRLCSIECCFSHDFESCPENQSFLSDLKGWSAVSPHLYIWDYVVNFSQYIMPYPNFYVLQPNIRTFRDNKAIGIMEQAAYQSRGGEFAELRAYLISKLLWNPECSVEQVIDDFMYGYYGRAGQYIRQYFDLLHNQVTPNTHIHLGLAPDDIIFSDEFIQKAERIFKDAEAVADNNEVLQRVEMAELPLLYLICKRTPAAAQYDDTYKKFKRIAKREGITHYAEVGEPHRVAFHKYLEEVK